MDFNFFGLHISTTAGMTKRKGYAISDTDLTLADRVDAKLARDIWHNVSKPYKLSASVAICGIKAMIDYVGDPIIKLSGPVKSVKKVAASNKKIRQTMHRAIFTEGNKFLWITYNNQKKNFEHTYFSMDDVDQMYLDIDSKALNAISFKQTIQFLDRWGNTASTVRKMYFDDTNIITEYDGSLPPGKQKKTIFTHAYGRLPIVWCTYGKGDDDIQGHGMIEPIEPYLACMHTVFENRIIEDTRSSRKKYVVTVEDPDGWLAETAARNGISTEGGVPLEDLDMFIMKAKSNGVEEKASYLNPGQSAADSVQILKLCFMNIIETMRIPEFVFPPKLGASFASAEIQVPTFVQLIAEGQISLTPIWEEINELESIILSRAELSEKVTVKDISWKRMDLESQEMRAKIVNYMMSSMKIAKDEGLMNDEEIRNYLNSYMNQLGEYKDFEKGYDKLIDNLKRVKEAFGASKANETAQEGDKLIDNENRSKNS